MIFQPQKNLLQPGAGTMSPVIISSLITGGSDGGGGHTSESIISSVTRIIPPRSGGSVREELQIEQKNIIFSQFTRNYSGIKYSQYVN